MATIKKIDIVNRAYSKLRISGLTSGAIPSEITEAVMRLDDFIAALQWNIGYIQPINYGQSDPNDDSGLTIDAVDPLTTLLAESLALDFGAKKIAIVSTPAFQKMVNDAKATLARNYVEIEGAKYPETLPTGIANEYPNTVDNYFYGGEEPLENDIRLP
jgi:hypothetical protein